MNHGERLIFFDLETGGLDITRHPITEIAAIAVTAGSYCELETIDLKVQFDPADADPASLGLNKYDPNTWAMAALPAGDVAEKFASFCRRHATVDRFSKKTGKPYRVAELVAHNGESFDGPFIHAWYRRLGMYLPAAQHILCTKQRAMWLFKEDVTLSPPDNYKLRTLCEYFGTSRPDHTALRDIRATVELARAIDDHAMRLTMQQQHYFTKLSRQTGEPWFKLLNRAISRLVDDLDAAA
ncbi:3'-5' exonuclease [Pirellulales bacterium]|nr:3'-5' exonuclease [Pirellulales bacterium]